MRILIILIISFLANQLCFAQKKTHLFFADPIMSIKVVIEKGKDSVRYEIYCKNISSQKIFLPKEIRSQVYSQILERIDITWNSGDTGLENIPIFALHPNEEYIYYTKKFPVTPNLHIGICYINTADLAEYSNLLNLNISKMLFSDIANEIIVSYGE